MKNRTFRHTILLFVLCIGNVLLFPKSSLAQRAMLRANVVSYQQVDLSWDRLPSSVEVFVVERKEDGFGQRFTAISGNLSGTTISYQDKTVQENRTYIYRVTASCDKSCGGELNEVRVTTPLAPPANPSNLEAFYISGRGMAITWVGNNSDGTTFLLERSENGGGFNLLTRVPYARSLSYNDGTTTVGNNYCYRVKAVNAGGESGYSNESCVSRALPKPAAPSGLSATAVSSSQIDLTWSDNADNETGFELERSSDGNNFSKLADIPANATSYSNTSLPTLTKFWYRILAKNAIGSSGFSNVAEATTFDVPPGAPTSLTAKTISSSQINLSWKDQATNEARFELERSTDGASFSKIADIEANTTTNANTGLQPATKYWYRVRSVNGSGPSGFSNIADATTLDVEPNAPGRLSATAVSHDQINLEWEDVSGNETGFQIERSTNGTTFTKIADLAANVKSYQNKDLSSETKYYYRIRAVNAIGPSAYSNVADATTRKAPIPDKPKNLTATPVDYDLVQLKWATLSSNATTVIIERSRKPDADFKQIGSQAANTTQFSDREILDVYDYYYRIKAVNSAGASPYSDVAKVAASQIITGTEPQAQANLIFIYDKILHITLDRPSTGQMTLYNTRGIAVKSAALSQNITLDLSQLPAGIYIAVLNGEKTLVKQKVLLY